MLIHEITNEAFNNQIRIVFLNKLPIHRVCVYTKFPDGCYHWQLTELETRQVWEEHQFLTDIDTVRNND